MLLTKNVQVSFWICHENSRRAPLPPAYWEKTPRGWNDVYNMKREIPEVQRGVVRHRCGVSTPCERMSFSRLTP